MRLVLDFIFIIAAKESKYPVVFKVFGYLAIITSIIFIFIGEESFQDFISLLIPEIKPYAPMTGVIDISIVGFLIYVFSRNKELEQELD